jgi:hypothetical protein
MRKSHIRIGRVFARYQSRAAKWPLLCRFAAVVLLVVQVVVLPIGIDGALASNALERTI